MIRILIFLLGVVFFAGAITYFASLDSRITGEAFGYKFDGPSGLIVGGLFALFLIAIYLTHAVKNIMAMPGKIRVREEKARRERGVAALTRGLEAAAVGDAADAAHHAKVARRNLDDIALTRLLTAQAAQLSGDQQAAEENFSAMLEAPETEFLGLKGLYLQARARDDRASARQYAERAFRLRANAQWAFDSVFELGLERGAWRETRDAIAQGQRNKLISTEKAHRATAALLTADAYAAELAGDAKLALKDAEAALKLAPGLSPAALFAARAYDEAGKTGKAAKVIETAFAAAAHPALIKYYDHLYKDEDVQKRADRLRRLAEKNSASREAALLQARADNLVGDWDRAIEKLSPLLSDKPTPAAFSLMAAAVSGRDGADAAQPWLEQAAAAPRDPRPGADGEFHFTREGWARLVSEYMNDERLAPPPLEETAALMSADDVRLLLAPPVKEEEAPLETSPTEESGEAIPEPVEPAAEDARPANENAESADGEASVNGEEETASENGDGVTDDDEVKRAAEAAGKVS